MTARSQKWRGNVMRWSIMTVVIVAVIGWFQFVNGQAPGMVARIVPFGIVMSGIIGGLAWLLVPAVIRLVSGSHPIVFWAVALSTMVVCAAAGTAAAATIVSLAGFIPARLILIVFRENISGTVPVTLIVGVSMTVFGTTTARLRATELLLKTRELEREKAEKLAAEAQLASLSSRVQPHFLFNTLNSISGLIHEDPAQAETMVNHLSSLLRSSLDGREAVPLDQELKLVMSYLEIQQTRHEGRLRYDLQIAPDATGVVPPFSLQTLVENSIKHVGGQRPEGVTVHISTRRESSELVLEIRDDGPGFDPDAMKAGHGLDILQRRLHAVCGATARMEFERGPNAMTVRLRIPIS